MKYNKRIWKTAVMALVVTMVFAAFAFRFEDWTKELNSEFVYAQSSGTTTGCTATTGGGSTGGTKVIPQIVVGSFDNNLTKYVTVIQIVNTGSSAISVTGNFYNENGTPSTVALKNSLATGTFAGTLAATTLVGGGVMTITGDTGAGAVNWGKVVTTGAASVSAYFELRDGATNTLYNRTGVASSSATMKRFVLPRVRNVASGLDVGYALVNNGSTPANITLTAKDANGGSLAVRTFTVAAGGHISGFPFQALAAGAGCQPCLTETSGATTTYGFLSFESTSASWSAIALGIEGANSSSFPVEVLE